MRYLCHPLGEYSQTSGYDYYTYSGHEGKVDIPCPVGTTVYSMTDGIVTQKFRDANNNTILCIKTDDLGMAKITHNNILVRYIHWSQALVEVGDVVKAGQEIALSGNEGESTGPHLHVDFQWDNGGSGGGVVRMGGQYASLVSQYYSYQDRAYDTIRDVDTNAQIPIEDYLIYHIFTQDIVKVTGDVPVDSNAAAVWNWFRNANIPNISNRPEVIAGILGNFKQESGIDILGYGNVQGTAYYGPWCQSGTDFKNYVNNAGFTFHPYGSGETLQADAVPTVLKWLTERSGDWVGWFSQVVNQVQSQTGTAGARAYAELFAVCVERCVNGGFAVIDPGVRQVMFNYYGIEYFYQDLDNRRDYAEDFYRQFASQ